MIDGNGCFQTIFLSRKIYVYNSHTHVSLMEDGYEVIKVSLPHIKEKNLTLTCTVPYKNLISSKENAFYQVCDDGYELKSL